MEEDDSIMEDSYHSYSSNEEEEEYHDSSSSEDEELTWETKPAEDWKKVDVENCFQMCKGSLPLPILCRTNYHLGRYGRRRRVGEGYCRDGKDPRNGTSSF